MLDLLVGKLVELLGRIAGFTVRWYFTPKRLADNVRVDISSQHEGVVIDGGECPWFHGWLLITNHNPFPVTLDRATGELNLAGPLGSFVILDGCIIPRHSTVSVRFHSYMHDWAAARLYKARKVEKRVRVAINPLFRCKIRSFDFSRSLEIGNAEIRNVRVPTEASKEAV